MRTVLLGSDFAYNKNGKLVPIEINTNLGMDPTMIEDDIFNTDIISAFITSHSFTEVTYIGGLDRFDEKLKEICDSLSIKYTYKKTIGGSTIPFVEDTPEHLIIRSAYDTTAIVDDVYCRDKVNFMKLIQSQTFNSEFAYINEQGVLVSNFTSIDDNGSHPNFILKSIFPRYDKSKYPKLYKVANQEELDIVLQNVKSGMFLMKYHINPTKLCENHTFIIRTLNILFPPDLKSLPVGQYTRLTTKNIDELSVFDSTTFELDWDDKCKYITGDQLIKQPKLLDSDQVEMADGSFKYASDLVVGDLVKSIKIPNPEGVDINHEITNYHITYDEFVSGSEYVINEVVAKARVDKLVDYATIKFTDGSEWEDTANTTYLALRQDEVRFLYLHSVPMFSLQKGEQVILVDTTTYPEISTILKTVDDVIISKVIFGGWEITVKGEHVFLTKTEGDESQSYAAIEHNTACSGNPPSCFGTCSKSYLCGTAGSICNCKPPK